jgi:hypothetical protein
MLLHTNGSLPNLTRLQRFWDMSATEKEKTLKEEIMDSRYDSNSLFAHLDSFYSKLIDSVKDINPSAFKKD